MEVPKCSGATQDQIVREKTLKLSEPAQVFQADIAAPVV